MLFEYNSTKGLKPQVSYIALLRMTHSSYIRLFTNH